MSDDTEAALAALRDHFEEGLRERLATIGEALAALPSEEALERAHRLAHSLTGAAATFGRPALARRARVLERYLKGLMAGAEIDSARIGHYFARIEACLEGEPAPEPRLCLAGQERFLFELEREGFEVSCCAEPLELIEAVAAEAPAAIVVDSEEAQADEFEAMIEAIQQCREVALPVVRLDSGDAPASARDKVRAALAP